MSVCERGNGVNELNWPQGVTIDSKIGNIYVSDFEDNCVKVFDSTGKSLFKFGDKEGEGKMVCPICIAIYGDRILISGNDRIPNYQLD